MKVLLLSKSFPLKCEKLRFMADDNVPSLLREQLFHLFVFEGVYFLFDKQRNVSKYP